MNEQGITKQIGGQTHEIVSKVDTYIRGMSASLGTSLFEELRLYYIGSVDGHNVEDLVDVLKKIKAMLAPRHILIHVITKTYAPAEAAPNKMHGTYHFIIKLEISFYKVHWIFGLTGLLMMRCG